MSGVPEPGRVDARRYDQAKEGVAVVLERLQHTIRTDPTLSSVRLTIRFQRDPKTGRRYNGILVETAGEEPSAAGAG